MDSPYALSTVSTIPLAPNGQDRARVCREVRTMSNRKLGNDFERELALILAANDFWVHRLNQNQAGQPFDIIAVKNQYAEAIDCKVCTNDKFELSRIEDNQHSAMQRWRDCGNGEGWFALKLSDGDIYMMSYMAAQRYANEGLLLLDEIEIRSQYEIHDWLVNS